MQAETENQTDTSTTDLVSLNQGERNILGSGANASSEISDVFVERVGPGGQEHLLLNT